MNGNICTHTQKQKPAFLDFCNFSSNSYKFGIKIKSWHLSAFLDVLLMCYNEWENLIFRSVWELFCQIILSCVKKQQKKKTPPGTHLTPGHLDIWPGISQIVQRCQNDQNMKEHLLNYYFQQNIVSVHKFTHSVLVLYTSSYSIDNKASCNQFMVGYSETEVIRMYRYLNSLLCNLYCK